MVIELETTRTRLRGWRPDDLDAFAQMNADPKVMEHFPAPYGREESDALAVRSQQRLEREGMGFFVLEVKQDKRFAGAVGLYSVGFEAAFAPAVEIAWRLPVWAWGQGYASEAARRCLAYGFDALELSEIVAFTARPNRPSQALMQRIGMTPDPSQDFDHPKVPFAHPLSRHVFYRITAEDFAKQPQ